VAPRDRDRSVDFRALAALEQLFTREGRWEEAIDVLEKRALVLDDEVTRRDTLLQAASTWEEKVEDLTRAAAVYERVRASDPTNTVASDRLEAIYTQQYKWTELVEVLLERSEIVPDVEQQISILNRVAKIYESEIGDQESAFYVLQAAFKRDYAHDETRTSSSASPRRPTAGRSCSTSTPTASTSWSGRTALGRRPVGQDRPLVREHLSTSSTRSTRAAGAADRSEPHRRARRHGRAAAQARLVERADRDAAAARRRRAGPREEDRALHPARRAASSGRCRTSAGRSTRTSRRSTTIRSSRPALIALDRLYRRTEQWEPLIDVLTRRAELETDEQNIVKFRLEIGSIWDLRLFDAGQAITAYNKVLDLDPSNLVALRAPRRPLREDGADREVPRCPRGTARATPSDAERVSLYERMAAAWEERFNKLDRAAECLEKIVAIDNRNFAAYKELARLYQASGKYEALVETYRNHIMATADVQTRIELYVAMGQIYEEELKEVDRAIEAYNDVLSFDATSSARSTPSAACTRRSASGTARST
jgi:tetratricopeptide (TPR) repeat protein